jgi:hypothetical protein
LTRNRSRAASHSCGETIGGVVKLCTVMGLLESVIV